MLVVYFRSFFKLTFIQIFYFFLIFAAVGCGEFKVSDKTIEGLNQRISATYIGPNEPAYCVGPTVYTSAFTINATAQYEYRELVYTAQFKGLGDVAEPKPIRSAEYVVLNNFGSVIQCGETGIDGTFTFTVPSNGQVFRLQVRSRADNNIYKASILRSPESNQIYHVEAAFTASANQSITVTAPATAGLVGGAFNILDQIHSYNDRLRTLTAGCTGCTAFTVAPKVSVYWERGFNPGSYYQGSPVASFYIKGTSRLFILGGVNGDVNFTDTDHFDNSIIAHEYFHFLEDNYSVSDSPGGSHNGNQLLDPRLAWSEGVAQFFQAVMTNISRVIDTVGNNNGASSVIVDYSVELSENDIPIRSNEGEFREFSIARLLWDSYDDTVGEAQSATLCTGTAPAINDVHDKCAKDGFRDFWSVLTGSLNFNAAYRFRSGGLFHQLHLATYQPTSVDNNKNLEPLRLYERQIATRSNYGTRLINCGPPDTFTMQGPFVPNPSGQFLNNHPVTNRRYLYFQHTGTSLALRLSALFLSGLTADVDLYIYPENYIIGNTAPIGFDTTANLTGGYFKDISVANVPPGNYMAVVDVRNFNSSSGSINFSLQYGSSIPGLGGLCLDAIP